METEPAKSCSYFWAGHILFLGRCRAAIDEHTHYSLQIIINREGLFQFRSEGSSLVECGGAIIRSGVPHQVLSSCDDVHSYIHLWIDQESGVAKAIAREHLGEDNVKILDGDLLENLRGCIDTPGNYLGSCKEALDVYGKIISELDGYPKHAEETVDPRVTKITELLKEEYIVKKVVVADLARHACLSESRLMHLFKEQLGMPIRRYVLWMRLMTALQFAAQGESLTEAAHSAGFSDSPHLCRTFRKMYGIRLTVLVKNSPFVRVTSCFS